ncbi:MAG: hypothetical protein QOJ73_5850 [Streptosporangiaceae bacterium]|jgi:hypothetical protein|nr:hypothetical protein [Streptosporangiaceae bacterium]
MPVHDESLSAEPLATANGTRPAPAPPAPATRTAGGAILRRPAGRILGRVPARWRAPVAVYVITQLIFLLWWIAFYPGLMSYDSVIYVLQVTIGPWVDNHSVLYNSLVWLSLHTTGGLAALTLAQTVAMSASFGYTVAAFRRLGVRARWTGMAAVIVAVVPPTGAFIVFIWKDVPFTICAFLIVPTLAHLVSLRGGPGWRRDGRVNVLIGAVGLELLGLMLFRLNGFIIVAFTAAILVVVLAGLRVRVAAVAVASIVLAVFLNAVVYPAVGIQKPSSSLSFGPAYGDIAVAYAERPSSFSAADTRLMARVAPLAEWRKSANCYDSDPTTTIPGFTPRAAQLDHRLVSLWLQILKRSPDLILGARICRGSIAWSIFPGPSNGQTLKPVDQVPANLFLLAPKVRGNPYRSALRSAPLSSKLNATANFLWNASLTAQLQWLLWRGAFWCYLAYLVLFAYSRARRNWAVLSLGAILVGQQLGVMADIPAQLYRYMVSPIFIGIMLVPLYFARNRAGDTAGDTADRTGSGS